MQCIRSSRRGCDLLLRLSELLSRTPPVAPPEPPSFPDDHPEDLPAGMVPGWMESSSPVRDEKPAGRVDPEVRAAEVPEPESPPEEPRPPAVPFVIPPPEPPVAPCVKGIVERLASFLPKPRE
jgi:hypothetical protein